MRSSFARRGLAMTACLVPLAATAQSTPSSPSIPTLQEIIVTASRSPEPLADAVGDVTVIDQAQLQAARGDSLAQIVGQSPGVQWATSGGPQTLTSLFVRGANADQTLVLLNGMPINMATSGGAQFPAIDPALVDHIEILRGAASSLYGSDAVGGVINLITRKAKADQPLSAWANAGLGSQGTVKSSAGLAGASQGWDYSFSTSAAASRGFDATRSTLANNQPNPGHFADRDGYRSHAFAGTLGYQWAPGHHIGLTAYDGYLDGDYDDRYTPYPDTYALWRQQAWGLSSEDQLTSWWRSTLRIGLTSDNYDDRSSYPGTTRSFRRLYGWTNTFSPWKDQQVSLLLERQEERVQGSIAYDHDSRDTNAVALVYKGRVGPLRTQASLRNDRITGYGAQTTGNLGVDLDVGQSWDIGVAGGSAFHAPSFNYLYYPIPSLANPNLRPERSRNLEFHVAWTGTHGQARLTVYRNRVRDLILTDSNYRPFNLGSATLRGATLEGSHEFGTTTVRGSVDLLDPRNDDPAPGEDAQLIRRARQVFHLSVDRPVHTWKLGAEYEYTGNRFDNTGTAQMRLGGYSLVNLTAAHDFNKHLGVQIRWNNILDKDYVLVDGYNTPGSNVFVNLSWKM